MISIIIPTLNEEKYIGNLLDSLEEQSYPNFEVIIVDASSDDNTVAVANRHEKKFNMRIITGNEKNVSKQKNIGAKNAKGDILIFLDADTEVAEKNFMEVIAKKFYRKGVIAAVPKIYINPKEERFFDRIFHHFINTFIRVFNALGGFGTHGLQIVRKDFFEKVHGYNEKLKVAEDVDLFRRIRGKARIRFLKDLKVYTSGRRFRKEGYLKVVWGWIINGLSVLIFRKSLNKEWKPIR